MLGVKGCSNQCFGVAKRNLEPTRLYILAYAQVCLSAKQTVMAASFVLSIHALHGDQDCCSCACAVRRHTLAHPSHILVRHTSDPSVRQAALEEGLFCAPPSAGDASGPNIALVLTAAAQIASALAHLHSHDIVHGALGCAGSMATFISVMLTIHVCVYLCPDQASCTLVLHIAC